VALLFIVANMQTPESGQYDREIHPGTYELHGIPERAHKADQNDEHDRKSQQGTKTENQSCRGHFPMKSHSSGWQDPS